MSTALTWQIESINLDSMLALADKLGSKLQGGEVIELISDLGGGKTTFVKGLARGMGSQAIVSSPSFTISNQYEAGTLMLYHFDFYRLTEAGVMRDELTEILSETRAVVVVEWGDIVADVLPAERMTIAIQVQPYDTRLVKFTYPKSLQHLIPINT